jgi:hypothetical protein
LFLSSQLLIIMHHHHHHIKILFFYWNIFHQNFDLVLLWTFLGGFYGLMVLCLVESHMICLSFISLQFMLEIFLFIFYVVIVLFGVFNYFVYNGYLNFLLVRLI